MTEERRRPDRSPRPLLLAGVLAVAEGAALLAYGVGEIFFLSSDRLAMGVTTAVFLGVYGVFVGYCGVALAARHSWVRSPVVLAQLIQLGVAWGFWGGSTVWVAVVLAVVAVATLVGVFHPASTAALASEEAGGRGGDRG